MLETRRHRGDLIQMFRIMSGKDDVSPSTWFQTMTDKRGDGVGTRQATGLYNVLPKQGRSEIRTNFFSQRVCTLELSPQLGQTVNHGQHV